MSDDERREPRVTYTIEFTGLYGAMVNGHDLMAHVDRWLTNAFDDRPAGYQVIARFVSNDRAMPADE
jgi:hypothetical protein